MAHVGEEDLGRPRAQSEVQGDVDFRLLHAGHHLLPLGVGYRRGGSPFNDEHTTQMEARSGQRAASHGRPRRTDNPSPVGSPPCMHVLTRGESAIARPTLRAWASSSQIGGFPLGHGLGLSMIQSLVDEVSTSPDGRTIYLAHRIPRSRVCPPGTISSPLDHENDRRRAA